MHRLLALVLLVLGLAAWSPPDAPDGVIDGGDSLTLVSAGQTLTLGEAADTFGFTSASLQSFGAVDVIAQGNARVRGLETAQLEASAGDATVASFMGNVILAAGAPGAVVSIPGGALRLHSTADAAAYDLTIVSGALVITPAP